MKLRDDVCSGTPNTRAHFPSYPRFEIVWKIAVIIK